MTHITKIAAVEMVTAIWEYDPLLPDNCVLNGSLDIIAAIQTLAIKVCHITCSVLLILLTCNRSSRLGSVLKRLKSCKLNVVFQPHSKSLCTAMFAGVLHITCSVYHSKFARYTDLMNFICSVPKCVVVDQLICCKYWPLIRSYHNHPTWWPCLETHIVVSIHILWDQLGTGERSMRDFGCKWNACNCNNEDYSISWFRTQTEFNKPSLLKSDQHYGELCLLSKSFKLLGKANTTICISQHTELQLVMYLLS
jgi:hypothetical protein